MARPTHSAAEKARELIAAGFGVKEVDSIGAPGMTVEEEEEFNDELLGRTAEYRYDLGLDEDTTSRDGSDNCQQRTRFNTYEDTDVQPPICKFRPAREPGLHLTDRASRAGLNKFTRAIDFFQLLVTDELFEMVVENTNIYGWLNILDKPSYSRKKDGAWENTCLQEMKQLVALIIFIGFAGRADIERNWSQATRYSGGWFRCFLSKNRFKALNAMLHVSKPGEEDANDKLAKIRPMIEYIQRRSRQYLQPGQNVSIDERMVLSKGRSPIQQYMPSKPTPYGYKLWCMCNPTSGYTYDFSVYTGKSEERTKNGLGFDVVTSLMAPNLNQGYTVFCDSFFSSVNLAKYLLENKTHICGTMQPWRRGFPQVLKGKDWVKKAKKGDMRYTREDGILMLQWFGKKAVHMISTAHRGDQHVLVFRRGKNKEGAYHPKLLRIPACTSKYNKCMGGVDLADQMLEAYSCLMKVTRWWKTLFFHMVDMAVLNSYILFTMWREANPDVPGLKRRRGYSHLCFHEARIRDDEPPPIYFLALKKKKSLDLSGPHDPDYTNIRHNCYVCYVRYKKERKSYVRCADPQCNVYLCLNKKRNCFPLWHTPEFDCHRYKLKEE